MSGKPCLLLVSAPILQAERGYDVNMDSKLEGKTALITGASSGIGETTARLLTSAGFNTVLAARREDRLHNLAKELGDSALPIPADVTDATACEKLVEETVERFGTLDVLVNNAGLGINGSVVEGEPENWRTMFDVNVLGVLYATRAAVRHMLQRGSGHVVFVSSLAGRRVPRTESTVYAATKHAITAVAEGLRMEVGQQGVRVTSIEPGLVRTEFAGSSHGSANDYYANLPFEPLEAEDVARAVLYAVSRPEHVSVDEVAVRPTKQRN
jgi:NADP-dependent 3-hydroxy acid dehydrogenase YdfG